MVKLTVDLVEGAMQYTNPLKDRELDLRGYKVPAIENLGSTLDQFDTIDFTDNEIRKLDNFPLLKRLKALIFTANKIIRIGEDLVSSLPNLETLILTDNNIAELKDLDPLIPLNKLSFLSLVRCPVTLKMNYRLYVIGRMPQLRFLDFKRITLAERKQGRSFVKHLAPITKTDSASDNGNKSKAGAVKTFVPGAPVGKKASDENADINAASKFQEKPPSNEQQPARDFPQATLHAGVKRVIMSGGNSQDLNAIQDAIKRAKTMDEVERLHHMLSSGQYAGFAAHWHKQQQQSQQQQ
ncbi:unnamed protein product [Hymenolepis diminuta]|uniref:LRRcap domain-containing protein n=1 Tax=Hymenolepis diminuta TaxID=6216 RepID=A0A0R3SDW7_HYMDI|nr:unnamed protein product [Hymenolepis diminuta]VUZ44032.1 unnamed protein product [Hymenolepis diminuta]